ncbi:amidohydrolase family protein [Nocardia sp. CA-119907]|uniref:amidohydrolase family protein n=1 Tax=Nocardia sp. CA-119907 TaxID=3239973 RepID=UPI003D95C5BF
MIDGYEVIDAHMHTPRLSSLPRAWLDWADTYSGDHDWREVYDGDVPDPSALDALLEEQGVDHALLFCEYSPAVTGAQRIEDLLPIRAQHHRRFSVVANINPHIHFPPLLELRRQLELGAVALKLHPVHGWFDPSEAELYPVYAHCAEHGIPIIVHSGVSSFPGARTSYGNPELLLDVADYFRDLNIVIAHGGRGWWYDVAAFMALTKPNVWLDLSGLPPKRLREYFGRHDLDRLARKMIFGTDWPGVPGTRRNVEALIGLGLPSEVTVAVLSGNARTVFPGIRTATPSSG